MSSTLLALAMPLMLSVTDGNVRVTTAQTVTFCALLDHAKQYSGEVVRVRAIYQTDFEKSALDSPKCTIGIPMLWVEFDKSWETRTKLRFRWALHHGRWGEAKDVVFVGVFRVGGSHGHMGMYPSNWTSLP